MLFEAMTHSEHDLTLFLIVGYLKLLCIKSKPNQIYVCRTQSYYKIR
jgi:hypothetical protein